jgi:hypothetical protein
MVTKWLKDLPAAIGGDGPIDNDAEIVVYWDKCIIDRDGIEQVARLAFDNQMDISDTFVQKVLNIAEEMRGIYGNYPDGDIHVQVRFNLNYCNM